jgi:DNA-binding transcriptional MerR regulator
MEYTMADLARLAGISGRTIRSYIATGFIAPPTGKGPAARYSEHQMLQAVCIARMRARGANWDEVAALVMGTSLAKLRAYVKKTEPTAEAPPAPPPLPGSPFDPPLLEGQPVASRRQLPPGEAGPIAPEDADLPDGPRWALLPLLPGMVLMVRDDAAAVVKRATAEIVERYGTVG